MVSCHYFPPGLRLPSQPKSVTAHRLVSNYIASWQRHMWTVFPRKVLEADRPRFKPATFWLSSERSTVTPHRSQSLFSLFYFFLLHRNGSVPDNDSWERGRVERSGRHLELFHQPDVVDWWEPHNVELRRRCGIVHSVYVTASGARRQSAGFSNWL